MINKNIKKPYKKRINKKVRKGSRKNNIRKRRGSFPKAGGSLLRWMSRKFSRKPGYKKLNSSNKSSSKKSSSKKSSSKKGSPKKSSSKKSSSKKGSPKTLNGKKAEFEKLARKNQFFLIKQLIEEIQFERKRHNELRVRSAIVETSVVDAVPEVVSKVEYILQLITAYYNISYLIYFYNNILDNLHDELNKQVIKMQKWNSFHEKMITLLDEYQVKSYLMSFNEGTLKLASSFDFVSGHSVIYIRDYTRTDIASYDYIDKIWIDKEAKTNIFYEASKLLKKEDYSRMYTGGKLNHENSYTSSIRHKLEKINDLIKGHFEDHFRYPNGAKDVADKAAEAAEDAEKNPKDHDLAAKAASAAKVAKDANPLNVPFGCYRKNCSPECVIGLGADKVKGMNKPFIDNFFKNINTYLLSYHGLNTTLYRPMFWLFCLGKLTEFSPKGAAHPELVPYEDDKSYIVITYGSKKYKQDQDNLIPTHTTRYTNSLTTHL